jgi:hypothetical protein
MRLPVVALVVLALATPVAAQVVYRNVLSDGRVVYSDQPVPGARAERTVAPPAPAGTSAPAAEGAPAPVPGARWPPPPGASQPPAPVAIVEPTSPPTTQPTPARPVDQPGQERLAGFNAAVEEVRAAERGLAAAQAELAAGEEPLPGERTGLARGGSRLNEAYWERREQLKKAVGEAQARLDRAVAERNALRF